MTKNRTLTEMLDLIKVGTNPTSDTSHENSILGIIGAGLIARDAVALNSYIRSAMRGIISHNTKEHDMKWTIDTINKILGMIGDE